MLLPAFGSHRTRRTPQAAVNLARHPYSSSPPPVTAPRPSAPPPLTSSIHDVDSSLPLRAPLGAAPDEPPSRPQPMIAPHLTMGDAAADELVLRKFGKICVFCGSNPGNQAFEESRMSRPTLAKRCSRTIVEEEAWAVTAAGFNFETDENKNISIKVWLWDVARASNSGVTSYHTTEPIFDCCYWSRPQYQQIKEI
ncbi:hypothetical protein U9M48_018219 [Paspalum notatum var. saurae]|uniref:Uncharacterized protein n=1 Tax=Paspalum notatum var. saurae TaxID=547442 RepID=A0AAQ3WPL4_PASNO